MGWTNLEKIKFIGKYEGGNDVNRKEIIQMSKDLGYKIIIFEAALDEAILGLSFSHDRTPVVAYDQIKCIEVIERTGKTREQAVKMFEEELLKDHGEGSPVFIMTGGDKACSSNSANVGMYM